MRILHVGKYYSPHRGGMETVLQHLAEGLLDRGRDVSVLVAGDSGADECAEIRGPTTGRGGRVVRSAAWCTWNSQPLTLSLFSLLRREIRQTAPDLVHLHLPNPLAAAAWVALGRDPGCRRPALAVWHHADVTRQRLGRILVQPLTRAVLAAAAGICTSSASHASHSRELAGYADGVQVIPFGIDAEPWIRVAPRRDGPFLFIGRLVPYKGLPVLLAAVQQVPAAELVIVGEGPQRAELVHEIAQRGLCARVRLAGALDREAVLSCMANARALVLPSLDSSETFGLVQLEAMAAGLPIVVSDLPTGVREVGVVEETCLCTEPGDVESLRRALTRLLDEPETAGRLGDNARRRFDSRFHSAKMIDRLTAWYDSLAVAESGEGRTG